MVVAVVWGGQGCEYEPPPMQGALGCFSVCRGELCTLVTSRPWRRSTPTAPTDPRPQPGAQTPGSSCTKVGTRPRAPHPHSWHRGDEVTVRRRPEPGGPWLPAAPRDTAPPTCSETPQLSPRSAATASLPHAASLGIPPPPETTPPPEAPPRPARAGDPREPPQALGAGLRSAGVAPPIGLAHSGDSGSDTPAA